ncbi:mas-related G-protein coupled receptor member B5-like [Scomber japonicus]|uniref:mas-related G-protein coupled receptor member B5-like n=1 Tax=Scomber japonicus TaxID=13676 RepID=UPI002306C6F3|nr:mas-related G-protein coupled receptor member B5-like [Scomber japonicus]
MEEQYSNNTFQNDSYYDYDYDDVGELVLPFDLPIQLNIAFWIAIVICLPLIIPAIYYLYSLVRDDHVAPIYVINLLISDFIQLCCMVMWLGKPKRLLFFITLVIHIIGVMASVGFMVCISLERYLVIAWPLWYRFRRTVKVSVVVCVVVWVLALVLTFLSMFIGPKPIAVILLLPFPVLIFSVVGIFKGLSAAISVSSEEKRRIVGATILVLLNYTLLFLPLIIWSKTLDHTMTNPFAFICLNPLGDLVLYVFMRKGAIDKILASLCCCRMETQQQQIIAVNDNNMTTVSSV